jgi:putative two-component system response regulator
LPSDAPATRAPAKREGAGSRRSINWKLTRAVAASLVMGFGVSTGFQLWDEARRWADTKRDAMLATAQIFAAAASAAVADRDADRAAEALRAARDIPGLVFAAAEDAEGVTIATAGQAVRLLRDLKLDPGADVSPLELLRTSTVAVEAPIKKGGVTVGRVRLVSDTAELFDRLFAVLGSAALCGVIALAFGIAVSLRLVRHVTQPLLALARTMSEVRDGDIYRARVEVTTGDEVGRLATAFNDMITELKAKEHEIVTRLVRAAEFRDTDTGEHIGRVAGYAAIIAGGLGLDEADCELLAFASTMHDVGKLGVPDAILLKPGPLTADERTEMQRHAEIGHTILEGSRSVAVQLAADIARAHHERWDGAGYPRGLVGEEIPLAARVVAVADVFDALTSERPYKKPWSLDDAKAMIVREAGAHFDPRCVTSFVERWSQIAALHRATETAAAPGRHLRAVA